MSYCLESICRTCLFVFWTLPILLLDGIRLIMFVVVLAPGFARFFWYYAVTSNRASIQYGQDSCRQTLDIYLPNSTSWKSANEIKQQTSSKRRLDPHNIITEESSSANNALIGAPCGLECLLDNLQQQQDRDTGRGEEGDDDNNNATTFCHDSNKKAPVVIFFTGGAWLIGYKMWGSLLSRALTAAGLIVVIPDYCNYPWSSVPTMVDVDVEKSIQWILDNIEDYGGNKHEIILVGQSAGGHLLCTALLRKAIRMATRHSIDNNNDNDNISTRCWQPTDFIGFISLSAPYDLRGMKRTFRKHGLDNDLVSRIFGFQIPAYEPSSLLQEYMNDTPPQEQERNDSSFMNQSSSPQPQRWSPLNLPPIRIYHGTRDKTVPVEGALEFANALDRAVAAPANNHGGGGDTSEGGGVTYESYPDWSHTDAILECPMDANHRFHCDIFQAVQDWRTTTTTKKSRRPVVTNNVAGLEQQESSTSGMQSFLATATVATTADPGQQQQQQQVPPNNGANDNIPGLGLVWPQDDPVIQNRLCPHVLIQIGRWCNPF